ncbi:hypothetical protein [Pseudomonas fluorescens]|uniref:hypothetical protein n=1 Tax=Pseudomonas fluorescens TaxID=294 RepID=UPI0005C64975|nr:hypothetical protein [Pseudomonas fluorescens]
MSDHQLLEEFQAYCDKQLIKPRNIYFQFWRDSRASVNAEFESLRNEVTRLKEDNLALLENPGDAL